jgi:hypothetical protein
MTKNSAEDKFWDEFYDNGSKKNLLLNIKNPISWYGSARNWMLVASMIRTRIEEDIPAKNEGDTQFFPGVFEPSQLGDSFWLQTLSARIRKDIVEEHFVRNDINFDAETTIDKHGKDEFPDPKYRKLHSLYPIYLYCIGVAMENMLKGIYVLRHTDSIYEESDLKIVKKVTKLGHRLFSLASKELQLPLDKSEEHLLLMLQDFVIWAGKYPGRSKTPDQYKDLVRGKSYPNPFSEKERANFSKDEKSIHNLYKRLLTVLDNEAKDRLKQLNA